MGNIKQADKLLTYEIQALTAYQQVINKCQNKHELLTLIYDDHYDAVFTLQRMIQEKFNHPNKDTAFTSEFDFQKEENPNLNDKQTIIMALLENRKKWRRVLCGSIEASGFAS